ncbi:YecR family lipoprotein [Shewanella sp. WPAGA9]|uniref:YecR family lipoprotein n=1 Tax=Shewanella sp. ENK2 TaxID=2775245 RepID=UPI00177BB425|nr:YecR family lipoprotein [Shewanella sp. WPAGA9]
MNKLAAYVVLAVSLALTGCATQKNWGASGGSKADGTVKLSYQASAFEVPQLNEAQGLDVAIKRCISWGYKSAETFDFEHKKCIDTQCNSYTVTKEYQCLN